MSLIMNRGNMVTHSGGCHCGLVRFKVNAPQDITAIECNCSICKKKQNIHFLVPTENFTFLTNKESLTCYQFNTREAMHIFCKFCGVQSFYQPRSHPDCLGILPHCLDDGTVKSMKIVKFDGENWEKAIKKISVGRDSAYY